MGGWVGYLNPGIWLRARGRGREWGSGWRGGGRVKGGKGGAALTPREGRPLARDGRECRDIESDRRAELCACKVGGVMTRLNEQVSRARRLREEDRWQEDLWEISSHDLVLVYHLPFFCQLFG